MSADAFSVGDVVQGERLEESLPRIGAYVVQQRWSGAQDRTVRTTSFADAVVLARDPGVLLFTVCRVEFDDGSAREYALPLGMRAAGHALAERSPTFMISLDRDDGRILYDALGDPDYVHLLWRALRGQQRIPTAAGALVCSAADPTALESDDTPAVRVLTVEQSNTSVEVGSGTFLKHLRRIEPGPSQELEMTTALTRAGFPHIAPMLGDIVYERDGVQSPLVLVQPFLRNSTDGWALALTSLRDLYSDAEEELARGDADVAAVVAGQGGSFVAEAARLGEVIASMHSVLADPALAHLDTASASRETAQAWADAMTGELHRLLAQRSPVLEPLRERAPSVQQHFDALRALPASGTLIRIHGDLHLGQTLRIDSGWIILDFEGEPNRTPEERRALSSPLRDVAGMLRSFDYAAAVALSERIMPGSEDWEGYMRFGEQWAQQNRTAFWNAYAKVMADSGVLPDRAVAQEVLRAFELQKAVYEVGYELSHRPSWTTIPLRFLLGGSDVAGD